MRSVRLTFLRFVVCSILLLAPVRGLALAAAEQGTASDTTLAPPSGLMIKQPVVKGDRRTGEYHLPGCPEYNYLSEDQVVVFPTEAEAQQAGYHKAQSCP